MNTLLTLAFNGAAYCGFQVQPNGPSVCAALQDAMQAVLGARPNVKGCSRTDAGVHARGFCASFRHESTIPTEKLPLALNSALPMDIRVQSARRVPEAFHARYDAQQKEYRYHILNSPVDDPLCPGLYHRVNGPLNEAAMHRAAQQLVGRHDFASFCSAGSDVKDTTRTIHQLDVTRRGDWVRITISADGFLYNMVRIVAGTLLQVGRGALAPGEVAAVLQAKNRQLAGDTLPAKGLVLQRVTYPPEALQINKG